MPIYWAFLTYVLLRPTKVDKEDLWIAFSGIDKVVHMLAFAGLSFIYCMAFPKQKIFTFLMIMLSYAIGTEFLQEMMDLGRSMEVLDFLADGAGIVLGYIFWKLTKDRMDKLNF